MKKIFSKLISQVSLLDIVLFTRHLSVMLKSGIPLGEALDTLQQQTKNSNLKRVLKKVQSDIANGQSLEKALARHPDIFNPFYTNIVRIGEESGNLEKNLQYLAEQLKKNYEFTKKIQSALLYPAIIIGVSLIAGMVLTIYVLPRLADLFTSLEVELPVSTRILLFIAYVIQNYGYALLILLIGGIILWRYLISFPRVRYQWEKLLLSLPGLGIFLQNAQLGFLCRNLGIMLQSGLPITTALQAQREATTHPLFRDYLTRILTDVEKGKSIGEIVNNKSYHYIPPLVTKMIGVGEQTGKLDESLLYLGNFYEEEIDNYARNITSILEPVILVVIGLVIAYVALAIISPIYNLTSSIHR